MLKKSLSIEKKKKLFGYVFLIPWLCGLILFFIQPLLQTVRFSLSEIYITPDVGGYYLTEPNGGVFGQYIEAFTGDAVFLPALTESLEKLLYEVPVIVVFSLVIAIILNQQFRGRTVMRALFFLPVIVASGIIIVTMRDSLNNVAIGGDSEAANIFSSAGLHQLLIESDVPADIASFFSTAVNNIVDCVWRIGVQILLFLAGLLSIPSTYYEVAAVEGSTPWETFWKITFPMLLPMILVNVIYTIVDSFSSYSNSVMRHITSAMTNLRIAYSSALCWIYFAIVFVILGVVYFVFSRSAHYEV